MNRIGIRNVLTGMIVVLAVGTFAFAQGGLSGRWKLDQQKSDNPREKIAEAMRNSNPVSGPGGGGPGGPHGDWGGFGGPHGGFSNHPDADDDHSDLKKMMEAPMELTISDKDPEFRIIDNSGVDCTYYTDGRKTETEMEKGRKVASTARRGEGSVVVETQGPKGSKITRTYELSQDGQQLFVKLRVPLPMNDDDQTVTITSVYNKTLEPATQTSPDDDKPYR